MDFEIWILDLYDAMDAKKIVQQLGLEIVYEKPIENESFMRISEYRKKAKQIVIFYPELENEAIAHELFHHLENINKLKLDRVQSEILARRFASVFALPSVL